jgi:hypothetical protein
MSEAPSIISSVLDQALSFGNKALNFSERYVKAGFESGKQVVESSIEFGSGLADVGSAQVKDLGDLADPQAILQRQSKLVDALGAKAQGYYEQVRGAVSDAQQTYSELTQELAGELSKGFKSAA